MRRKSQPRQKVLSVKVTEEARLLVEQLTAHLTIKTGKRHTLTDVVEAGILLLAKKEKVDGPKEPSEDHRHPEG